MLRSALVRPTLVVAALAALAPVSSSSAAAAEDAPVASQPTYNRDVAPILAEHCVGCHRPADIAPMPLRSYDEVRPWAKSIRKAIEAGEMPPWHADPTYGHFANDRRLSDLERDTLVKWVKQGAPEGSGEPAAVVDAAASETVWRLGAPDLEVRFDEVELPAGGPDQFEDLRQANPLEQDRWVSAIEIAPGDRRVVHHVIVYVVEEGQQQPSGWLGAWAAGMEPMVFPEGTARLLKKGSRLIADMHYHPTDEPTKDSTTIGLHFLDGEPQKELINLWVQNASFKIPAGADDYEVRSAYTFRQDSVVHALLPHMHYRGKDFTYTAVYPDGRREILLKVPAYDFNWQTLYQLAEPLELPEGSRIECVAHYDNSTKNPDNPDPGKDVTFGNESFDEMMIGFVDYTVKDGLRPPSVEERLARIRRQLEAEHPREVFRVKVWEKKGDPAAGERDGGQVAASDGAGEAGAGGAQDERGGPEQALDTALHFPAAGADGLWYIPLNGDVIEAKLLSIAGDASAWSAKLQAPFGSLEVAGSGGFGGGTVAGTITMGKSEMGFEGALQ